MLDSSTNQHLRKAFSEKDAKVCESIFLETLTKCNDGDPVTNQPQAALSKGNRVCIFIGHTFPYPAPPPPSTSSTTLIIVSYKCRKSKKEDPVKKLPHQRETRYSVAIQKNIFTFVVIVPSWFLSNTVKASLNVASSYNQRCIEFFLL